MNINFQLVAKKIVEKIPYGIGQWTSHIPFHFRLGSDYSKFCTLIQINENASPNERYKYIIERLDSIVKYAQANIPFYQNLYGKTSLAIKSLKDFENLPVITKSQVREYTKECSGAMLLNTGGSTDGPLSFYIDNSAWAREWAHMHYIWGLRGYKQTDLIITMLGKNIGVKPYRYNAVHNEILLNPFINAKDILPEILMLFRKYPVQFFQGYPSTIYNFFKELEPLLNEEERIEISKCIRSCFFSSEYPMPYMIEYLKNVWNLDNYLSWYGHSEMCVLAYDKENNYKYKPFVTYGYAEEVDGVLVGTSFHNYDMPLIRYSTEDIIEANKNQYGMMDYFKITRGRNADFIEDKSGRKISVTFAIGRHHKIYNIADFIQISQTKKGKATFYITFKNERPITESEASDYFDLSNIDIDFDFVFLNVPVLTKRGKLKLKILHSAG